MNLLSQSGLTICVSSQVGVSAAISPHLGGKYLRSAILGIYLFFSLLVFLHFFGCLAALRYKSRLNFYQEALLANE